MGGRLGPDGALLVALQRRALTAPATRDTDRLQTQADQATASGITGGVLQAVWAQKGAGPLVWLEGTSEADAMRQGYTVVSFGRSPHVVNEGGATMVSADQQGQTQEVPFPSPPDHEELQDVRYDQGEDFANKLFQMSDQDVVQETKKLEQVNQQLAQRLALQPSARNAFKLSGTGAQTNTKPHKMKAEALMEHLQGRPRKPSKAKKPPTNAQRNARDFRALAPRQDEFTQTEGTLAFFEGALQHPSMPAYQLPAKQSSASKAPKKKVKKEVRLEYLQASFECQSLLRTDTRNVQAAMSAPAASSTTTTSTTTTAIHKHPSADAFNDDQFLGSGASSHSFADRERVAAQNATYEKFQNAQNVTPNALLFSTSVAALSATTDHMMLDPRAKNTLNPSIDKAHEKGIFEGREMTKDQGKIFQDAMSYDVATTTQPATEPHVENNEEPFSPARQ